MKILVAGAGGVGGYYGARLASAGHDVWFLARGANLEALRERGLEVRSEHGDLRLPDVRAVADAAEAGRVDHVLFCVKAYDNEPAASACAAAVGPGTAICSLQNGVENESFLSARFPEAVVLGGLARIEAFVAGAGVVEQRGPMNRIQVGAFREDERPAATALAGAFDGTGVAAEVVDDVEAALWSKLLGICSSGSITAYGRCTLGEARADPALRALMVAACEEVASVAAAAGVRLPEDAVARHLDYAENTIPAAFKSSMFRDLERGRPLEVEWLNGAVVRFGEAFGVPTPANRTISEALAVAQPKKTSATS